MTFRKLIELHSNTLRIKTRRVTERKRDQIRQVAPPPGQIFTDFASI